MLAALGYLICSDVCKCLARHFVACLLFLYVVVVKNIGILPGHFIANLCALSCLGVLVLNIHEFNSVLLL